MENKREPYNKRYYLLYGNEDTPPENIDMDGTLNFLEGMGFGENSLKIARENVGLAEQITISQQDDKTIRHFCDFCGAPILGVEYDILKDGRERCTSCTRTSVKTEEEFIHLLDGAMKNLNRFFGIKYKNNIKIKMVNAKTLHSKLGETFIPTNQQDERILGVAIKESDNDMSILVENGSPRVEAIKTLVHELTHIWQYQNWDAAEILRLYGTGQRGQVYEGMAKWVEVQYTYLLGEKGSARREELLLEKRIDDYGIGFLKYSNVYPLSTSPEVLGKTPFDDVHHPL